MNDDDLREYLLEEFDVQIRYVDSIVYQVKGFTNELKCEFYKYVEDGKRSSIEIKGYTIKDLKNKFGLNEIGSFLALSWIESDSEKAIKMLEYGI